MIRTIDGSCTNNVNFFRPLDINPMIRKHNFTHTILNKTIFYKYYFQSISLPATTVLAVDNSLATCRHVSNDALLTKRLTGR